MWSRTKLCKMHTQARMEGTPRAFIACYMCVARVSHCRSHPIGCPSVFTPSQRSTCTPYTCTTGPSLLCETLQCVQCQTLREVWELWLLLQSRIRSTAKRIVFSQNTNILYLIDFMKTPTLIISCCFEQNHCFFLRSYHILYISHKDVVNTK